MRRSGGETVESVHSSTRTPSRSHLAARGETNSETFPITSMQFNIRDPLQPPNGEATMRLIEEELSVGSSTPLATACLPAGVDFGLQEHLHGRRKGEGWTVTIGAGSQDMIYKGVNALMNPGDVVLVEAPVYAGVLTIFHELNAEILEVNTDGNGVCSHRMREILRIGRHQTETEAVLHGPVRLNPTGSTTTSERRLEVLALSREHDFFILEDDPYCSLYFGPSNRPPFYFALERDQPEVGRVLRFDSLSKTISAGLRVGFASGPEPILRVMDLHSAAVNMQPPTFSQVIALKILSAWGYNGFTAHTAQFYREKRDVFEAAMQRHLAGLAEWTPPEAGMFFWFKLLLNEPGSGEEAEGDSEYIIRTTAVERGVLALPGATFYPNPRKTPFVRASFSLLPENQVDEALRRLREVVLEVRKANKRG
ncbi:pyridoxal phosphate-dependent transferase [Fomitopsis serialis]|uniref:pyridoxal phosphate-dependent transferase n=1 Tax=Fomitopsis serialis TaxID=139415 RepID=UPI002007C8CC|nr:pyridoxal phosphate-dependent transferase [Neoantrodia serialis]KAH9928352.1 pyridoxal phosphate-dependent transferase [Neoantrodia serialis]